MRSRPDLLVTLKVIKAEDASRYDDEESDEPPKKVPEAN
jgi:hypothetical protein